MTPKSYQATFIGERYDQLNKLAGNGSKLKTIIKALNLLKKSTTSSVNVENAVMQERARIKQEVLDLYDIGSSKANISLGVILKIINNNHE